MVIDEGLEDLLDGTGDETLTSAYQVLLDQLQAWGIRTVILTQTPCEGYAALTRTVTDDLTVLVSARAAP